jgi:hypothetical protein
MKFYTALFPEGKGRAENLFSVVRMPRRRDALWKPAHGFAPASPMAGVDWRHIHVPSGESGAMKTRNFAILALAAGLAGCASTGNNVTAEQMQGIERGKTTRAEVEAKLGKPTFERLTPDGLTMIFYVHVDPDIRPASFRFINEGPTAGVDAMSRSAGFFFDDKGVLFDVMGSERRFGTSMESVQKRTF